jgi:hypothetical protein
MIVGESLVDVSKYILEGRWYMEVVTKTTMIIITTAVAAIHVEGLNGLYYVARGRGKEGGGVMLVVVGEQERRA